MTSLLTRPWLPRLLVGLSILLSGVALMPYVQPPPQRLDWQLYAQVYEQLTPTRVPETPTRVPETPTRVALTPAPEGPAGIAGIAGELRGAAAVLVGLGLLGLVLVIARRLRGA